MKLKHWIVFILLGLIWSTSFLWIKIGVREISPMALVTYRMSFGTVTASWVTQEKTPLNSLSVKSGLTKRVSD